MRGDVGREASYLREQLTRFPLEIKSVTRDNDVRVANRVPGWVLVAFGVHEVAAREPQRGAVRQ